RSYADFKKSARAAENTRTEIERNSKDPRRDDNARDGHGRTLLGTESRRVKKFELHVEVARCWCAAVGKLALISKLCRLGVCNLCNDDYKYRNACEPGGLAGHLSSSRKIKLAGTVGMGLKPLPVCRIC